MIQATDKRTPSPGFSTGRPEPVAQGDTVMVQPITTYMEGSGIVGPSSEPYPASRHHAEALKTNGFALIVEPKPAPVDPLKDPEDDTIEIETPEIEQPDDSSRAPAQQQETASTVPALPGAEPQRPGPGAIPPAATSEAPKRRRGRAASRP